MKTILVTGASSGIGFSVVKQLLDSGYFVIGVSRTLGKLEALKKYTSNNFKFIQLDLTDFKSYEKAFSDVVPVDGVVHCAGIVINNPIKYFNLEKYNAVVSINQTAPLVLISSLLKFKKLAKDCSIVFISSINGPRVAIKGCAAYAASKCALVGIMRVLSLELSPMNIRVNSILPGMVETELVDGLNQLSTEAVNIDKKKYPLGNRYAKPDEIAETVEFLISSKSKFITGQEFVIDGGYCVN
jgi:NAD(P)-dependent dehydrogenase (short-subunit alcohol dehydrogenase family)